MIEAYHMFTHGVRMILLWQMSRFEAAHYALSCLFEATNQLRIDHVSLATHLIDAATGASHQPIPIPTYSSIAYLQNIALDDMTPHWYDHSGFYDRLHGETCCNGRIKEGNCVTQSPSFIRKSINCSLLFILVLKF